MSGPMSEDPKFRTVSEPDNYPGTTESAVTYVPVTRHGSPLGYVWAAVTDDAGGFVAVDGARDLGNASMEWIARFRWAKANGVRPLQVLSHFAGREEDERAGYVPVGVPQEAPSLTALKAVASADDQTTQDPRFQITWGSGDYPRSTESPLLYVVVTLAGKITGYLWAAVSDDAMGFLPALWRGEVALQARVDWVEHLRRMKAQGLRPLQVLRLFASQQVDAQTGYAPLGAEQEAPTLNTLKSLAS